jgi:hypothetical protein
MWLLFSMLVGCSDRDTLTGTWTGDVSCKEQDFGLDILLSEIRSYEYEGQFLFRYEHDVTDGNFYANILYDVEAVQPMQAGAQEITFFNVIWSELGCKTVNDDGSELAGGCQSNGLDTSDFEEEIGDMSMDFNGIDRLIIDDGNCQGAIYR